ncbi:MAG: hypothetical protein ABR616_16190 [Dermatophilaceae bacterium]
MRNSLRRGLVLTAAIGLLATGCGDGQPQSDPGSDEPAATDTPDPDASEDADLDEGGAEQMPEDDTDDAGVQDPNDDIEDGVYRGNGVALPVPDGWSIDPAAFQQGVVAATPDDGAQQLTAQAIDTDAADAAGTGPLDIESLLDGVRQQIQQDPDTDEPVDALGADTAHRLTYLQLPAQQEGQPETSATIVLAETDGLIGEFVYSAAGDNYDEAIASALLDGAGFDPDSEPTPLPQPPQPAPDTDGDDGAEEPTDNTD